MFAEVISKYLPPLLVAMSARFADSDANGAIAITYTGTCRLEMLRKFDPLAAVVAAVAPDVVVPSPPATTMMITLFRHCVSAVISRVTSVFASSSMRPSGRSVCVLVVLLAGMRPPDTCSAAVGLEGLDGTAMADLMLVFAPDASAATTLKFTLFVPATAAALFPLTVVFM